MKKVGFVGGVSWVSTVDYYRYVNEQVNAKLGGLDFAECAIYSINFGELQRRGWLNAFELLRDACYRLKSSGVDAIVLCANTAHIFEDDLASAVELPIISIVSETAMAVKKKKIKTIGLIGTKVTMEHGFYAKKFQGHGLNVVVPEPEHIRNYIQETVKEELGRGISKQETKNRYIEIVDDLRNKGCEGIILGCTEIPLLLGQEDFSFPVFDSTRIHSNAIVDFIIS
jgi:aspartate racemase